MNVVQRLSGNTPSEKLLVDLCERTFHKLWTYPRVFRDQGKNTAKSEGKEICDVLVVFGRDVLIFSDKSCAYPSTGDERRDWSRWRRRAVDESVAQLEGAERWIRHYPDRIFLDNACQTRFPINIAAIPNVRIHRIVVATGAAMRCKRKLGGNGSLPIHIISRALWDERDASHDPTHETFLIRQVIDGRSPVHVFDEVSLPMLMNELDTTYDFVNYLNQKEALARDFGSVIADGEDELVGAYLSTRSVCTLPSFPVADQKQSIVFTGGISRAFRRSDDYRSWKIAASSSVEWDQLIDLLGQYALGGELIDPIGSIAELGYDQFSTHEEHIRHLARLGRIDRIHISISLRDMRSSDHGKFRERTLLPITTDDAALVLMIASDREAADDDSYRAERRDHAHSYALLTKLRFPDRRYVVTVILPPYSNRFGFSADVELSEFLEWTPGLEATARRIEADLAEKAMYSRQIDQYDLGSIPYTSRKIGRNEPCPCGKPKKYKKCCGKQPH
jgi:hypothetical protein